MNKTKEAIEAALEELDSMIGCRNFEHISEEAATYHRTIEATLKAVLASLPDEGGLLPCPFCNSRAEMRPSGVRIDCQGDWCNAFMAGVQGKELLAQAWNTRALQQRLDKEIGGE